jgi:hypothetical protein
VIDKFLNLSIYQKEKKKALDDLLEKARQLALRQLIGEIGQHKTGQDVFKDIERFTELWKSNLAFLVEQESKLNRETAASR